MVDEIKIIAVLRRDRAIRLERRRQVRLAIFAGHRIPALDQSLPAIGGALTGLQEIERTRCGGQSVARREQQSAAADEQTAACEIEPGHPAIPSSVVRAAGIGTDSGPAS